MKNKKSHTLETVKYFLVKITAYKFSLAIALIALLLAISFDMWLPIILKDIVNIIAGEGVKEDIFKILAVFISVELLSWVFWRIGSGFHALLEVNAMEDISEDCFMSLHRQSFQFFNDQFVGALVKRATRMVYSFEEIVDRLFYEFLPLIIRTIFIIVVFSLLNVKFGLAVFFWVVFYIACNVAISRYKLVHFDLPKAEADTAVTAHLADTVANHSTIRFFGRLLFESGSFSKVVQIWKKKQWSVWKFDLYFDGFTTFLMIVLDFFVLYFAVLSWLNGDFTPGDLILLQVYLMELYRQLFSFGRTLRHSYELFANANEMMEIIKKVPDVMDVRGAKEIKVLNGEVVFKNVHFSYSDDTECDIIKALSFKVKPGERVALIGPSGGGKTTIIKLLLRLFDLKRGHIFVDGQDISKVTQNSLRKSIALVPQDPVLFHRSLMENIRYGRPDASDQEVINASKLAHAHEFISNFKDGYDTFVGERGVKLSGGERQRVAIARAILADTRILILDEATSSLDSESEKLIKDALNVLMKNKTVFVIAHRLSTIIDMDRIIVLENGQIIEEGSHKILLQKEDGLYKKLWKLQVGGYLAF